MKNHETCWDYQDININIFESFFKIKNINIYTHKHLSSSSFLKKNTFCLSLERMIRFTQSIYLYALKHW